MGTDYPLHRPPRAAGGIRCRAAWLLLAIAAAGLAVRLGFWQLDRAHEKERRAALMAARGAEPPLDPAALARAPDDAPAQIQRRIALRGTWRPANTVFLANRTMAGRVGFEVLTPLQLAPGDGVLVQRGWVARDPVDPAKLPALPAPGGEVEVRGRIAVPPVHWVALGAESPGPIRQNVELAAFAREAGIALRPLILIEDANEANRGDGLQRDWAAPNLDIARNQGYALQWFAIGAAILALALWLQILRPRLRRSPTT